MEFCSITTPCPRNEKPKLSAAEAIATTEGGRQSKLRSRIALRKRDGTLFLVFLLGVLAGGFLRIPQLTLKMFRSGRMMISQRVDLPTIARPPDTRSHDDLIQSDTWHDLEDDALFAHALNIHLLPNSTNMTCPPRGRIAFMFLTRGPLPLALLWGRFLEGHQGYYSIYVHTAPNFVLNNRFLPAVFRNRQIPSKSVEWGAMSVVDAERRLLGNALLDVCNERFVLVSETCVPLYNFSFVYDFYTQTNFSFVSAFDDKGPYGRGRYTSKFLPEIHVDQWRKGSQWFEMTRQHARFVINDTIFYPKFLKHCVPHCYNDEHYIPTILSISHALQLANVSTTYVDWSRGGFHPRMFYSSDITTMAIGEMKKEGEKCFWNGKSESVCTLFARKMAASAVGKLWQLSKYLGY